MSYFSERNGMRKPVERTSKITAEMYAMIYDCCNRYHEYLAWKFPEECPNGNGCCGIDNQKFNIALRFEVPNLYRNENGIIAKPNEYGFGKNANYDQYALLDYIEFISKNCKDISERSWHKFFSHYDLRFEETREIFEKFREEINYTFDITGALYTLTEFGIVERIVENSPLSSETETALMQIKEKGTKELLEEAITLFKQPNPASCKDAVEKLWDALERLKTYYPDMNKASSVAKIIGNVANDSERLKKLFDDEFLALTSIGNDFRIRHHETSKVDITDYRHYEYFFNRCLSLIALAIKYLH